MGRVQRVWMLCLMVNITAELYVIKEHTLYCCRHQAKCCVLWLRYKANVPPDSGSIWRLQYLKHLKQRVSWLIWFIPFRMDKQQFISWTIPWSGSRVTGISAVEPGSSPAHWASKQSTGQQPMGPTPLSFWCTTLLPATSAGMSQHYWWEIVKYIITDSVAEWMDIASCVCDACAAESHKNAHGSFTMKTRLL